MLAEQQKLWGNSTLPPMSYVENNVARGFGVDITKAVFEEARIDYSLELAPWKRAYNEGLNGRGIVFGVYWTEERAKLFDFSEPLWEEKIVLVTKKGKEFDFGSIDDLKGKVISMQRGTRPGTEFEEAIKNKLFKSVPNHDPVGRLSMLKHDRVEVAVFNPGISSVIWNAKLAKIPFSEFTVLKRPLAIKTKHIGIAKSLNRKDLIIKINDAIMRLQKNGVLDAIIKKYENVD